MEIYTVKRGDSLFLISRRSGISVEKIASDNQLVYSSRLAPGQALMLIPAGEAPGGGVRLHAYCYPFIGDNSLEFALNYLSYLHIFSYELREDGSLSAPEDMRLIEQSKAHGVKPILVVTNINAQGSFDTALLSEVFKNPAAQERLISSIHKAVEAKGYSGIDINFEYVARDDRERYTIFLAKCAAEFQPKYTLSMAVPALTEDNMPGLLFEGQDYAANGAIVDWTLLMTYDWGYRYGPPMAIAPYNLIRGVLDYAVTRIPSKKLLLGVPNYAYDWPLPYSSENPATLRTNIEATTMAASNGALIGFDAAARAPYYSYHSGGRKRIAWFDDSRSLREKYSLVPEYGLLGAGIWNVTDLYKTLFYMS